MCLHLIDGKLKKFYEDVCLLNQFFIKNDKATVQQYVAECSAKLGNKIAVKEFIRIGIGR